MKMGFFWHRNLTEIPMDSRFLMEASLAGTFLLFELAPFIFDSHAVGMVR